MNDPRRLPGNRQSEQDPAYSPLWARTRTQTPGEEAQATPLALQATKLRRGRPNGRPRHPTTPIPVPTAAASMLRGCAHSAHPRIHFSVNAQSRISRAARSLTHSWRPAPWNRLLWRDSHPARDLTECCFGSGRKPSFFYLSSRAHTKPGRTGKTTV
jgi:hypothetical protein